MFITITHAIFPNKPFCLRILQMLFYTNFSQILQIVIPDVWQSMQTVFVFSGQFVVQILQKTFGPFC